MKLTKAKREREEKEPTLFSDLPIGSLFIWAQQDPKSINLTTKIDPVLVKMKTSEASLLVYRAGEWNRGLVPYSPTNQVKEIETEELVLKGVKE